MSTCLFLFAVILAAGAFQSEVAADIDESFEDPPLPVSELITGSAVEPTPGSESVPKDPFTPYDIGDPASAIPYEALSPDEQAVIDRGRDAEGWRQVHAGWSAAIAERARLARADAAARTLGIDELGMQGVVP